MTPNNSGQQVQWLESEPHTQHVMPARIVTTSQIVDEDKLREKIRLVLEEPMTSDQSGNAHSRLARPSVADMRSKCLAGRHRDRVWRCEPVASVAYNLLHETWYRRRLLRCHRPPITHRSPVNSARAGYGYMDQCLTPAGVRRIETGRASAIPCRRSHSCKRVVVGRWKGHRRNRQRWP